MGNLFGTDGVRGIANQELTGELAYQLGRAGAFILTGGKKKASLLVGKDTRLSGDLLEASLSAGICAVGANALQLGVLPTPAVSFLIPQLGAWGGVVISASHNPASDNGIKFLGARGEKLSPEAEEEIEALISRKAEIPAPVGAELGRILNAEEKVGRYVRYLKEITPVYFQGLKIVLDCAHGANFMLAPQVLTELGAEVTALNINPDGTNINQNCGSLYPAGLQQAVRKTGAQVGFAYDGDGDRVIAVDEKGNVVDGDQIMVVCGLDLKRKGCLAGNTVVVTVMSNLGLHLAFRQAGVNVCQTPVGDRYVLAEMERSGAGLGGEQSGHIVFRGYGVTGDGLVTTLQVLKVMVETEKPLSVLAAQMERFPQAVVSVRVRHSNWEDYPKVAQAVTWAREKLGVQGRILVRPSGTEPLLRIMAEGPSREEVEEVVAELAGIAKKELG